jgi:hypothetical protein
LDKQEKVTCRGSATHNYTRPQAARQFLTLNAQNE